MSDLIDYKGYFGSVRYSRADRVFHGKLEFIRALVTYEARDVEGLENAFREAVDDYLDLCAGRGEEPEQPFKGTFNVRTGSDLHRRAALYARVKNMNLNAVIVEALKKFLPARQS